MPAMAANRITANVITEIEQMVKDARPMELRELTLALGLPDGWFTDERAVAPGPPLTDDQIREAAGLLAPRLLEAAGALGLDPKAAPPAAAEPDHPDAAAGGARR